MATHRQARLGCASSLFWVTSNWYRGPHEPGRNNAKYTPQEVWRGNMKHCVCVCVFAGVRGWMGEGVIELNGNQSTKFHSTQRKTPRHMWECGEQARESQRNGKLSILEFENIATWYLSGWKNCRFKAICKAKSVTSHNLRSQLRAAAPAKRRESGPDKSLMSMLHRSHCSSSQPHLTIRHRRLQPNTVLEVHSKWCCIQSSTHTKLNSHHSTWMRPQCLYLSYHLSPCTEAALYIRSFVSVRLEMRMCMRCFGPLSCTSSEFAWRYPSHFGARKPYAYSAKHFGRWNYCRNVRCFWNENSSRPTKK